MDPSHFFDESASECKTCDTTNVFASGSSLPMLLVFALILGSISANALLTRAAPRQLNRIHQAVLRTSLQVKLRLLIAFFQVFARTTPPPTPLQYCAGFTPPRSPHPLDARAIHTRGPA